MAKSNENKIAIYSRKSKFTGKGESIENQIELCKQYIQISFPQIDERDILVFEDEGFSGGNTKRPQFQSMMKQVKERKFNTVICYRLDRISRNVGDFANMHKMLEDYNVDFVSISEKFDTHTSLGKAMMNIAVVFAQLERETTAERIKDNMQELAKTGRWLGGKTPTGYCSEPVEKVSIDGKTRKMFKLSVIDNEAILVKTVFSKFIETNSLTKTETFLINKGLVTRNGNNFTRFAIKNILTNPVYMVADERAYNYFDEQEVDLFSDITAFDGGCAIMAYNKTLQKPNKAKEVRDVQDWIIAVGKHQGLIESSDWIKAQELLERNKSKSYRNPKSNVALLSGLLYCGNCGSFMRPKQSQRKNSKGDLVYDYLCEMKEKSRCKQCNMKRPNGNTLDELVSKKIKELSEEPSVFLAELENAKRTFTSDNKEYEEELKRLRKEFADTKKEIEALISTLSRAESQVTEGYILSRIEELDAKNKLTLQHIRDIEYIGSEHIMSDVEFDVLKSYLSTFKDTFDNMNVEQKRTAIRTFVKKIVWDGENVQIYLFGSTEDDVEFPQSDDSSDYEPQCEDSK